MMPGLVRRVFRYAAVLMVTLVAGCQQQSFPIAPVSGTVTINGEPVSGAKVKFQPIAQSGIDAGSGSYATTDDQGRFTLALILEEGEGAVVGEHKVFITTGQVDPSSDQSTITGERVPRMYREGEVTFTVPKEGTTKANFDITSSR